MAYDPPVPWPMTPIHGPVPENILSFLYFLAQFYLTQNKYNKAPSMLSSHQPLLSTSSSLVEHSGATQLTCRKAEPSCSGLDPRVYDQFPQ